MTLHPDNEELRQFFQHLARFKYGKNYDDLTANQREHIQKWHNQAFNEALQAEIDKARLRERQEVALDNYRGHTFSDSTNWKGKFEKFIQNNERRIATLTAKQEDV